MMQRLKRGDLTRINALKGRHTDVYHPAPPAVAATKPKTADDAELASLRRQVSLLTEEAQKLEERDQKRTKDSNEIKTALVLTQQQLAAAEEKIKELSEAPVTKPITSIRIQAIEQVRSRDDILRIDCQVEPVDGTLNGQLAIYLTIEESEKLRIDEEYDDTEDNE